MKMFARIKKYVEIKASKLSSNYNKYLKMAETELKKHKLKRDDIKTGRDAWTIAHRSGITEDAYKDRDVTDGHIQSLLEKIFPNAVFKDKKRY